MREKKVEALQAMSLYQIMYSAQQHDRVRIYRASCVPTCFLHRERPGQSRSLSACRRKVRPSRPTRHPSHTEICCNVILSPTDVSLTEISLILCPLDKASLNWILSP
jgi:hypothetical protein